MVVGRDARISGPWVRDVVCGTLNAMGIDVIDLGLSTTPTVELAVPGLKRRRRHHPDGLTQPQTVERLEAAGCRGRVFVSSGGERVLALAKEGVTYAEVDLDGDHDPRRQRGWRVMCSMCSTWHWSMPEAIRGAGI